MELRHLALLPPLVLAPLVAFVIYVESAEEEPYHRFDAREAWTQLGVGASLATACTIWIVVVLGGVVSRRLDRAWLGGIVVMALTTLVAFHAAHGYVADMARHP